MQNNAPETSNQRRLHAADTPEPARPAEGSARLFMMLRNLLDDALDGVSEPATRAWIEAQINGLDRMLGIIR